MAKQIGSEISHVLFRQEDGWTPSKAAKWLEARGVAKKYTEYYEAMESGGGEKLQPGDYLVFRIVPGAKKFSSYGYSDEKSKGIWFKFAGHRGREAGEKKTRLDLILDQVQQGKREVTFDMEDYTEEQRDRIIEAAKARGLHVSGTRRWILVRDLRGAASENKMLPAHLRTAWDVYLDGKKIDKVFYSGDDITADYVRRSLINHDGYDSGIVVKKARKGASDHLGTGGEYYLLTDEGEFGPFGSEGRAWNKADKLEAEGVGVNAVVERDEFGNELEVG